MLTNEQALIARATAYRVALGRRFPPDQAEDVAQEVVLVLLAKPVPIQRPGNLAAMVAGRRIINRVKAEIVECEVKRTWAITFEGGGDRRTPEHEMLAKEQALAA